MYTIKPVNNYIKFSFTYIQAFVYFDNNKKMQECLFT